MQVGKMKSACRIAILAVTRESPLEELRSRSAGHAADGPCGDVALSHSPASDKSAGMTTDNKRRPYAQGSAVDESFHFRSRDLARPRSRTNRCGLRPGGMCSPHRPCADDDASTIRSTNDVAAVRRQ